MRHPVEPSDVVAEGGERPLLRARLLGSVHVTVDGRDVDTSSSRRTRHVLAYLLMHRRSATSRDVLMDTFWPDAGPTAARNSLHVALTGVRQALRAAWPGEVITRRHDTYRVSDEVAVRVDVDEFAQLCRDGRRADREGDSRAALASYAAADRLYEGDLLADDPYADWASFGRDSLRLDLLDVQQRLAELHAEAGDHASAVLVARRALSIDPCNETLHRRLMRSYHDTDQLHRALSQFHRCAEALWREHRVHPSADTIQLHDRLRRPQGANARRSA